MYVCICSAVTDKQIEKAVAAGAKSVDELTMLLGVGACCGLCREEAGALIAEVRVARRPSAAAGAMPLNAPA